MIDIFENNDYNDEIRDYVANHTPKTRSSDAQDSYLRELATMLSSFSELNQRYANDKSISPRSSFNAYAASQYAMRWATERNLPAYQSFQYDCANFGSQIMEAAGVAQVSGNSVDYGWWHKVSPGGAHSNSRAWSFASSFTNFHNRIYATKSFSTFSGQLLPGDFIAYDTESDGLADHIGFVTYTGSWNTYGGKYYRDFRVAQHTGDYHAWVSSSTNGWETKENGVRKFIIIRK